jgi:hypothetical protein
MPRSTEKKNGEEGKGKKRRATNDLECGYGRDTRELLEKKGRGGTGENKEQRKKWQKKKKYLECGYGSDTSELLEYYCWWCVAGLFRYWYHIIKALVSYEGIQAYAAY